MQRLARVQRLRRLWLRLLCVTGRLSLVLGPALLRLSQRS